MEEQERDAAVLWDGGMRTQYPKVPAVHHSVVDLCTVRHKGREKQCQAQEPAAL